MKNITLSLIALIISVIVHAQNIFPKKVGNCITTSFCLDCGDIKANVDEQKFNALIQTLNASNNLKGLTGNILFQVLLDSTGKGCVLSHTDQSNNIITQHIVAALNNFDGFIPASTNNKPESRTSFNISFEISNGTLTGKVERVDMDAFKKSFDHPQDPEIYNKKYKYKNEHLGDYKFTIWNSENSNLPDNMNDHITIDSKGIIWITADDDLVTFDGQQFKSVAKDFPKTTKRFYCSAVETDNNNSKWIFASHNIYSYDDKNGWVLHDSAETGAKSGYEIVNNPATGEVYFCSDNGLLIYKDGTWTHINQNNVKELPSNNIFYAKKDSRNRIWIGSFKGTIMIDSDGMVTNYNETSTVLKGKSITSMDEDENGNLYFGLYEFSRKVSGKINNDEGIAIMHADGSFKQFTTSNSGMPFNHTTKVLYDKNEKVLWIATDRAGLVRFDLKDGWENYHSTNSDIPTSYIASMALDAKGNLYLATRQGLVKMEKE